MINSIKQKIKFLAILIALIAVSISCERDISDDAVLATFPNTAEVYTDNPVGLTDEFFISIDPAEGANPDAFGTDDVIAYEGTSSIRIAVPSPSNPNGNFVGGVFRDRGEGRDLSGYDALTFWAKGSINGKVDVGFGSSFLETIESRFPAVREGIELTTDWQKYTVPIPDPSKLVQERGLFFFAAGGFDPTDDGPNGNEVAWTFWLDEIRYEKLGTTLFVGPSILNGADETLEGFIGSSRQISDIKCLYNLENGSNVAVTSSPFYFNFSSSSPSVATVDETGLVTVIGDSGETVVTATVGDKEAEGSLTVTSDGPFPLAPVPPTDDRPASNVVSLFSDAYNNVPVRHYNGFFEPYQTTQGGAGNDPNNVDIKVNLPGGGEDNIINYTQLNFVSIGTYETVPLVDVSATPTLHVDINVRETIQGSDFIRLQLESGTGVSQTQSASFNLTAAMLTDPNNVDENGWFSMDIPIASFAGTIDQENLGQLLFISDGTISDIWVDNVYFFTE